MSLEQALLTGISALTGALVFLFRILWQRSEQCEKDRVEMRLRLERLEGDNGRAQGELKAVQNCKQDKCPFRVAGLVAAFAGIAMSSLLASCASQMKWISSHGIRHNQSCRFYKCKGGHEPRLKGEGRPCYFCKG